MVTHALTYDDIQLVPSYSNIESRGRIDLSTQFTKNYYLGIPLVASPMDTVCASDMAIAMMSCGGVGVIHRFMSIQEQASHVSKVNQYATFNGLTDVPVAAAVGANGDYLERAQELTKNGCNVILIDVAHGHHKFVKDAIGHIKANLNVDVIAGNIVTGEATIHLIDWGADALRVGIGGGCFTPEMRVGTRSGMKPIVDVQIGDVVYTHTGEPKEVIHKFEYDRDEEIMIINGIECTKNHEFYVVHKSHEHLVTDENIHQYARWTSAEELTDEFLLIEL
jgi:IMP dehydrogenase